MLEQVEVMYIFFIKGGTVLTSIFMISLFMWILILERYWFIYKIYPKELNMLLQKWQERNEKTSWFALKTRTGLLADISIKLKRNLLLIKVLTHTLPLLGLLGTVTGMISIFEVINIFGTGNTRGIATGISRALLPTTAGLVTSIIGIYLSSDLNRRTKTKALIAKDLLTH